MPMAGTVYRNILETDGATRDVVVVVLDAALEISSSASPVMGPYGMTGSWDAVAYDGSDHAGMSQHCG